MSRYTHQVEVTPEQLRVAYRRARIAAVVLFVGFFTMFVAFAPHGDQKVDPAAAVAAVDTP